MTLCKNAYAMCSLFKGCKNDYFLVKKFDDFLFLFLLKT